MQLRIVFWLLIGLVILERLFELVLSRRNARRVLERGGVELGREHYPFMVSLHLGFFVALVLEATLLRPAALEVRSGSPWPFSSVISLGVVLSSMALRYWAIAHLGDRWNTRVLCEPGRTVVVSGPYRFFRHPNYIAVVLELAFLPLVGGAWRTAVVFSVLNAWMLKVRIRVEEDGLRRHSSLDSAREAIGSPRTESS